MMKENEGKIEINKQPQQPTMKKDRKSQIENQTRVKKISIIKEDIKLKIKPHEAQNKDDK